MSFVTVSAVLSCIFIIIFFNYFGQYLIRGAQFSSAGLNGVLMKRKNNTKKITGKKIGTTKYRESIGGSIWLGS